jgi:hypothetical protein
MMAVVAALVVDAINRADQFLFMLKALTSTGAFSATAAPVAAHLISTGWSC